MFKMWVLSTEICLTKTSWFDHNAHLHSKAEGRKEEQLASAVVPVQHRPAWLLGRPSSILPAPVGVHPHFQQQLIWAACIMGKGMYLKEMATKHHCQEQQGACAAGADWGIFSSSS